MLTKQQVVTKHEYMMMESQHYVTEFVVGKKVVFEKYVVGTKLV